MMLKFIILGLIAKAGCSIACNFVQNSVQSHIQCANSTRFSHRVESLVASMTLEEKAGQLTQINIGALVDRTTNELDPKLVDYYVKEKMVGSFLNNLADGQTAPPAKPEKWIRVINQVQTAYRNTRLQIPMVYGLDSVHGANYVYGATLFPQQLGLAATFNRTLARLAGEVTAKDTRAVGVHWNFSPILDIAVNKQWPRVYETFGEDSFLASEMGKEMIYGYQGPPGSLNKPDKVAATMKHFIGYSASRSGKDIDGAWMSERIVNDYFRPSFQAAVDNGVATAMESYSDIEGEVLVISKKYLVDLLRENMGFSGMLVTDWGQIEKLHDPIKVAPTIKDAVRRVMSLGSVDMSMVPNNAEFIDYLIELVRENRIPMDIVNTNVKRVLQLKQDLGLLDSDGTVSGDNPLLATIGSSQDRQKSLDAARESVILLKNENQILPLKKDTNVFVTGPTADSLTYLNGGWTFGWQGAASESWFQGNGTTIIQGLKKHSNQVSYVPSIDIWGKLINNATTMATIVDQAKQHDVIIVCVGEWQYAELNGNVDDMHLPRGQLDLIDSLIYQTGKPVIVIISQGRPRVFRESIYQASAILNTFLIGSEGGEAIAEVVFGDVNPSGKLPVTYTNHPNDNNVNYYRRANEVYNVAWEFGFGLSYTTFSYSNLQLSASKMTKDSHIDVKVSVTNTGTRAGKEVVFMYISDEYRSIAPEVKRLRGFEKIELKPGTSKEVEFVIYPQDLAFYGLDNRKQIEAGNFIIIIQNLSQNFLLEINGKQENEVAHF